MDAGEWYIEVNGRKVGPFTLDQVRGLLDDGEIRPYHQVTSLLTGGQWISVEEALQETPHGAPAAVPLAEVPDATAVQIVNLSANVSASPNPRAAMASGEFSPPPRPELTSSGVIEDQADPALSLFDALQIEKERRTTIRPLSGNSAGRRKPLFRMPNVAAQLAAVKQVKFAPKIGGVSITPRMFWTAVFAGLVLGSLTYGVMRAFKHHAPPQSGSFTPYESRSRFGEQNIPTLPAHQPLRPITHPVIIPPRRGRTIPPPPPPAHMAYPPRGNDNGGEYNEPPRNENNSDNGYPPQENDGEVNGANGAVNGSRTNNPAGNGYPPSDNDNDDGEGGSGQMQQDGSGEQQGEPGANQQDPNAQNPDANGMPPANAPGQDSFRPTQNGGGQQAYPNQ